MVWAEITITSYNAEELFNTHAGIDTVEEPLDMAPPALQGTAGLQVRVGHRVVLEEHSAEPANHLLNPLQETENKEDKNVINANHRGFRENISHPTHYI